MTEKKSSSYTRISPLFKEYILVSPESIHVDVFRLENGHWELERHNEAGGVVELRSLGLSIPISEIYEGLQNMRGAHWERSGGLRPVHG